MSANVQDRLAALNRQTFRTADGYSELHKATQAAKGADGDPTTLSDQDMDVLEAAAAEYLEDANRHRSGYRRTPVTASDWGPIRVRLARPADPKPSLSDRVVAAVAQRGQE